MINVAAKMGFAISIPKIAKILNDQPETYANAIMNQLSQVAHQLVFCVVPNNHLQRYSAIKKKLCVERPTPSQVILYRTMTSKNLHSVAVKVAIQINCKLGGIPWTLSFPNVQGLMVVGFDVCHDKSSGGKDYGKSLIIFIIHWSSGIN